MPTTLAAQFSGKAVRPVVLAALAAFAALLGMLAVLYQKAFVPFSSRSVASVRTSAACAAPAQSSTANDRKQLFVSCAGFLD